MVVHTCNSITVLVQGQPRPHSEDLPQEQKRSPPKKEEKEMGVGKELCSYNDPKKIVFKCHC